ncbi:6432_t:CDS:2 [Scutellospora calospora]|uniref:6432_t:CDS:1 n=1 Tax=Scutellospora calospora TaxID=85575 RepID=A0ACA9KIX5_9GLOM|nr:6432_t:CDS:2 [Scutellospora calospora]
MPQTYNHRLTKYIHVQNDLGLAQKTKRAICKACESKESIFQKGRDECLELWQVYEKWGFFNRWDRVQWHWKKYADETTARNAVIALRQARAQNNTLAMSIISSGSSSRISDASELTLVSRNMKRIRTKQPNTSLDTYFVVRQLSPTEQNEFHRRLLCMIVENGLSFRFTGTKTFHEFVAFFNTTVKIPSRRTLSKKILKEYAEKLESSQVSALLETQEPVTIMFDGWKNVCRQEILGAVILSATNRLYIWGAEDISGTSQKTDNVLNTIRAFLECAKNQNLNVVAMVTDSASSYASARINRVTSTVPSVHLTRSKITPLCFWIRVQFETKSGKWEERSDLVFLPCFAHQANLCIGDIFRCSSEYKRVAEQAIEIVAYFTDKRHSKAISLLHNEQQRIYKTIYSFVRPVITRWNSYYYCFAALIRSKRALQSYSILHLNSNELSSKARSAINSTIFWKNVDELADCLLPFVSILDYLQHDAANLFDVIYSFAYVAQQYEDETNGFGYAMLKQLEKRWADWEQPLLFLAWFNKKPKHITLKLTEYYIKRGIFTDDRFNNTLEAISDEHNMQGKMSNNVVGLALLRYWEFAALNLKEIGMVAQRLYSIKVNSAPCERLFSRMGWFHNSQ